MKRKGGVIAAGLVGGMLFFAATSFAQTHVDFRIGVGGSSPDGARFDLRVHDYDGVPYEEYCDLRDRGICDEDIPVIVYIRNHSRYSIARIASLRARGATWDQLSAWCGVPLLIPEGRYHEYRQGPPYGNAYGYWRHGRGRGDGWGRGWDRHDRGHGYGRGDRDDD